MRKKQLFIAVGLALLLASCNQKKATGQVPRPKAKVNDTKKGKEQAMTVTEMTTQMFKERVMNYDKNKTEWVFEGTKPVVIDFYATWCGPCKVTAPIIEELAKDYAGQIDFYKVDVDREQELSAVFGIRSIPTFLFVPKEGKPTMQTGAMSKAQFEQIIKETILK